MTSSLNRRFQTSIIVLASAMGATAAIACSSAIRTSAPAEKGSAIATTVAPSVSAPPSASVSAPVIAANSAHAKTQKSAETKQAHYQANSALVWQKHPTQGVITSWVENSNNSAHMRAESTKLIGANKDGLWMVKNYTKKFSLCKCPGTPGPVWSPKEAHAAKVIFLSTNKESTLAESLPQDRSCKAELADFESGVTIHGVIGSIILFNVSEMGMGCMAAHPFFSEAAQTVDITTGNSVPLTPPANLLPELQDEVHKELAEGDDPCLLDPDEKPSYFGTVLGVDSNGTLVARYQFTMGAPYACGTGPGHYSVLGETLPTELPASIAKFENAPPWLADFLSKHSQSIVGISPVPDDLDLVAIQKQWDIAQKRLVVPR